MTSEAHCDPYVVTISTNENPQVHRVVARAAKRFTELNHLPVHILREHDIDQGLHHIVNGNYTKAFIWDLVPNWVETVLYYDRDIVAVRPLGEIPEVEFGAAPDHRLGLQKCQQQWPLFKRTGFYFNSGLLLARRKTRCVFDMVKAMQCEKRDAHGCYDQTLFNLVAQQMVAVTELPRSWNYAVAIEDVVITKPKMIHCCGLMQPYTFMELLLNETGAA